MPRGKGQARGQGLQDRMMVLPRQAGLNALELVLRELSVREQALCRLRWSAAAREGFQGNKGQWGPHL